MNLTLLVVTQNGQGQVAVMHNKNRTPFLRGRMLDNLVVNKLYHELRYKAPLCTSPLSMYGVRVISIQQKSA